jgi:hypothetical protein
MGGTLAVTSSFAVGGNNIQSTATSCTEHGEPGSDGYNGGTVDGTVSSNERYDITETNYALQKFYCLLAAESHGPETVSGAVSTLKMVACAVERNLGTISFNNTPVPVTSITIDTNCATLEDIVDMGGTSATGSVTMTFNGTITAATNPSGSNWPEVAGNTYYTHGLRIASDDGTSLKYLLLAKFDDTVAGDPVENGDFEFATMGTGTLMQGTAIEYTAGRIDRSSATSGSLWFEMRVNRIKKTDVNLCQPSDPSSQSCGFARHTRIKGDITFASGDITDVSNLTGIMTEGYDDDNSGQMSDFSSAVTATGSLATEITGKTYWASGMSPADLGVSATLGADFTAEPTSCIIAGGAITATGCGLPLAVDSTAIKPFYNPSNSTSSTWIDWLSTHGGIGYSGSTTAADTQAGL